MATAFGIWFLLSLLGGGRSGDPTSPLTIGFLVIPFFTGIIGTVVYGIGALIVGHFEGLFIWLGVVAFPIYIPFVALYYPPYLISRYIVIPLLSNLYSFDRRVGP